MIHFRLPLWPDREDVAITALLANVPDIPGMKPPKRPAMIVVPGGAYLACSTSGGEGDETPSAFFAAGYQTFVLEYSVAMHAGAHPTAWPAPFLDFAKAILTIREHADEWHVDVSKISICGFSAGGHLCGMLATRWFDPILQEHFDVPAEVFRPAAAILCYPVADYMAQAELAASTPEDKLNPMSNQAIFGTATPTEEQLRDLSPCLHVSDQTAPLFLLHCMDDAMVTPAGTLHLAEACLAHGIECEAHLFYRGGHGVGIGNDMQAYRRDRKRRCSQWLDMALQWLSQQLEPDTKEKNLIPD